MGLVLGLVTVAPAGAAPDGCDSTYPAVDPGSQKVIENFVFAHEVVEVVTELERVVGPGLDLGPAPPGAPVFDALPPGTTFVDPPVVERTLTDTTFETESSVSFACSENLVITSESGDSTADWPNVIVLEGQLTVTTTDRLIETRHVTETTIYTVDPPVTPRFTG